MDLLPLELVCVELNSKLSNLAIGKLCCASKGYKKYSDHLFLYDPVKIVPRGWENRCKHLCIENTRGHPKISEDIESATSLTVTNFTDCKWTIPKNIMHLTILQNSVTVEHCLETLTIGFRTSLDWKQLPDSKTLKMDSLLIENPTFSDKTECLVLGAHEMILGSIPEGVRKLKISCMSLTLTQPLPSSVTELSIECETIKSDGQFIPPKLEKLRLKRCSGLTNQVVPDTLKKACLRGKDPLSLSLPSSLEELHLTWSAMVKEFIRRNRLNRLKSVQVDIYSAELTSKSIEKLHIKSISKTFLVREDSFPENSVIHISQTYRALFGDEGRVLYLKTLSYP